jgi:hypothetical protein
MDHSSRFNYSRHRNSDNCVSEVSAQTNRDSPSGCATDAAVTCTASFPSSAAIACASVRDYHMAKSNGHSILRKSNRDVDRAARRADRAQARANRKAQAAKDIVHGVADAIAGGITLWIENDAAASAEEEESALEQLEESYDELERKYAESLRFIGKMKKTQKSDTRETKQTPNP